MVIPLPAVRSVVLIGAIFQNCGDGVSTEWQRFNGLDDQVIVEVGPVLDTDASTSVIAELTSTTGETVVGQVRVSPGSGPIGTQHRVVVEVGATWEDDVGRVDVEVESPGRGSRVLSMDQDSADAGTWVLDLRSYGATDEVRTDLFRIRLYELVEVVSVDDPAE